MFSDFFNTWDLDIDEEAFAEELTTANSKNVTIRESEVIEKKIEKLAKAKYNQILLLQYMNYSISELDESYLAEIKKLESQNVKDIYKIALYNNYNLNPNLEYDLLLEKIRKSIESQYIVPVSRSATPRSKVLIFIFGDITRPGKEGQNYLQEIRNSYAIENTLIFYHFYFKLDTGLNTAVANIYDYRPAPIEKLLYRYEESIFVPSFSILSDSEVRNLLSVTNTTNDQHPFISKSDSLIISSGLSFGDMIKIQRDDFVTTVAYPKTIYFRTVRK